MPPDLRPEPEYCLTKEKRAYLGNNVEHLSSSLQKVSYKPTTS